MNGISNKTIIRRTTDKESVVKRIEPIKTSQSDIQDAQIIQRRKTIWQEEEAKQETGLGQKEMEGYGHIH